MVTPTTDLEASALLLDDHHRSTPIITPTRPDTTETTTLVYPRRTTNLLFYLIYFPHNIGLVLYNLTIHMICDTIFDLVYSSYMIAWRKLACGSIKSSTPLDWGVKPPDPPFGFSVYASYCLGHIEIFAPCISLLARLCSPRKSVGQRQQFRPTANAP